MKVIRILWSIVLVAALTCVFAAEPFSSTPAQAQVSQKKSKPTGGGFFSRLFGLSAKKKQPQARQKRTRRYKRSTTRRKSRRAAPAVASAPVIKEEAKSEDAKTLLVVGDGLAQGVADGLKAVYAQTPSIKVKKLTYPGVGLVKSKEPDWPEEIVTTLEKEDVGLVVVMLGLSDDGDISIEEDVIPFQSRDWTKEYRYRVASMVAAVRNEQLPLIWVGLAPAEDYSKSANFSFLNDLYVEQVEPAGGVFVDIWRAFLDENGIYTREGPDVSGKTRQLRTKDGNSFTWSGYRKIAYFVEKEIARVFGSASAFIFEGVKDDPNFMVLTGRLTSPEVKLISGEEEVLEPIPGTPHHTLTISGEDMPNVAGRVDDPRWPPY
ncbi:SGNH/GDSL hydrolase family protein [Flexibacterium corallicola]|uniref:SGNH/GDSL hydrolase family protein n=1 Tax=Flexibacterium corallicola TaxID=3037259 RepID=UPI00286F6E9F|nr:DUF459 domain-containing protein [Pseudovibrio sp. M1P-2-3]